MKVYHDLLGYPKYTIVQDTEMFSFSTDSMLLASFPQITRSTKKIVDLCSGNFPVPMYLTLKTDAKIIGVEIQEKAIELAKESLEINKLEDQVEPICANVKGVHEIIGKDSCDLVLCNPPFFKVNGQTLVNEKEELLIARHEVLISLDEVVKEASILLREGGYFNIVHRPERFIDILESFKKYHLVPTRIRFVYPKMGREANHVLIEGRKGNKECKVKVLDPLYIMNENGDFTEEMLKIYNYKKEE